MEDSALELRELRRQLARLKEEARRNEETWRRSQQREMELLEAETLQALLDRLVRGLRESFRLQKVTLLLADPEREIRHLLMGQGGNVDAPPEVLFVDTLTDLPARARARRPWLGPFNARDHARLFPGEAGLQSVALLPLARRGRPVGCLAFGSAEPDRFTERHGSDFLHHLAVIAAFALENGANRARLTRSGFTDVLTGWHNRRYLETRLQEEIARSRRDASPLVCLMIDVDHFKRINDRHGHLVGDRVLREVARRIQSDVRGSDVSARYGGEEFVVLLPNTPLEAGQKLAERIRSAVCTRPFDAGLDRPLPVSVSIGLAEHRDSGDHLPLQEAGERLLGAADAALYEAKASGRNAVSAANL